MNLTTLLRTLGDGNMHFYDLADDVEDVSEEFVELSKSMFCYLIYYIDILQQVTIKFFKINFFKV
jgi:hypothetical protein